MSCENLVIKKVFKCSKRTLFDAWSSARVMSQWFFAASLKAKNSKVECDFRVGGGWSVTMYFEDGSDSTLSGQYQTINRYSQIIFSWKSPIASDGRVELNFKEISTNRSELKLVHSLFPSEESRRMHNEGWLACLTNLERYLTLSVPPE